MKRQKSSILMRQARRFKYAIAGISEAFSTDVNMRLHYAIAVAAIILGFVFEITTLEWLVQFIFIALVISLEMLNSAIELLVDEHFKSIHPTAKRIKDISAGAVLVASVGAFIAGCLIYWPVVSRILGQIFGTNQ